jgi:hypothetical protein
VWREWQRSGLTRTSTTLPMVYVSLMCRCPGQGDCEIGRWLVVLLAGLHRSDRCITPVRPMHHTSQTGAGLDRQGSGFHARKEARFG